MFKWFLRSGVALLSLMMVQSSAVAFQFSDVSEVIRKGPQRGLDALQTIGDGGGDGFYSAIYADTIRNPNRLVEEKIKDRFGIDFKVDLTLPAQQGQYLFTDFFQNPGGSLENPSAPVLRSSLQSDCVRVKAAQAEDEARRWDLVKRRLNQRSTSSNSEQVRREVVLRLVEAVDDETRRRIDQAFAQIPAYDSLNSQQQLLRCYEDLSTEVDFELKLQSLLNPTRKQIESLQTFMNGRLDDFQQNVPLTDFSYGTAFPRYDLLFDIDVIDMIFFGTAVATDSGRTGSSADTSGADDFDDYQEILAATFNPNILPDGSTVTTTGSQGSSVPGSSSSSSTTVFESAESQFGSSSRDFSGPLCVETATGLVLDYSPLEVEIRSGASGQGTVISENGRIEPSAALPPPPLDVNRIASDSFQPAPTSFTAEGSYTFGKNRKAICEGTVGVNLGNDFLHLLFCLDIRFAKLGKTWQSSREDNCIACHVSSMNQIFEEKVLKSSVRPHKNTGTIMESAICEDGFGDDVGFHFFLEWVPVKFYPDICYPKGGVTDATYAELIGYPEIVARVNRPGFYVDCQVDFTDEDAVDRCREALQADQLSYEDFRASYLNTVNQQIQSVEEIDKESNIWAKLVGDQGIAQRELHFFLYRSGKDLPWYGEDDFFEPEFKNRMEYLRTTTAEILRDPSLVVDAQRDQKTEQLLCLKGSYFQQGGTHDCRIYDDTFRELEEDINMERERVAKISRRWNLRSQDFNEENSCSTFSGSGPFEAFWKTFEGKFSLDYYLETDTRKTQTAAEQVTGQISANTQIEDLNRLFSEINQQVEFIAEEKSEEVRKQAFEASQEESLQLYTAFAEELTNFRSTLQALTDWWAKMVDEKDFISKGGQRVSLLESFFEKLR
jgi:hypothetical protein